VEVDIALRFAATKGRINRPRSVQAIESGQENSEEQEMTVFTEDPNTHINLRHLRGDGEPIMDDTPPRSTRFMRYMLDSETVADD
jgi:hypothetical protein